MSDGRFGIHGGQYIPETLMNEIINLEKQYNYYKNDPEFCQELDDLLKNYAVFPNCRLIGDKHPQHSVGKTDGPCKLCAQADKTSPLLEITAIYCAQASAAGFGSL